MTKHRVTAGPYTLELPPNGVAILYEADEGGNEHQMPGGSGYLAALVQFAGEIIKLRAYAESRAKECGRRERIIRGLHEYPAEGGTPQISSPNPANLSRESCRILNETMERPERRQTTTASNFLTDATEIAIAAFDDSYMAEYTTTGATDNKAVAMRAAVESIVALCAMEAEWKPGDPRCDQCDNGILSTWIACPYCGCTVSGNIGQCRPKQEVGSQSQ